MRNFFLLFLIMVCTWSMSQAQDIVNSSFEIWNTNSSAAQEQPDNWTAGLVGNVLVQVFGMELPIPVDTYFGSKTTDAHSGEYALQLQPKTVGVPGTDYSYPFPGILQYGTVPAFNIPMSAILEIASILGGGDVNIEDLDMETLSTLMQAISPGQPISQIPAHLNLWVKYNPEGDDAFMVMAFAKMDGDIVGTAEYYYELGGPLSEYTLISVPFEEAFEPCDSLMVIILTGQSGENQNTTLVIDDVTVDYTQDGIAERETTQFTLAPNPTQGLFFIRPQEDEVYNYAVYDLQGRIVCAENNQMGVTSVNTNNLAKGVYVVRILQNGTEYPQKIVVR